MHIIEKTDTFQIAGRTAVAIGKFDGIHIGHKKLIECINAQKAEGLLSVVFTFDPVPAVFFGGEENVGLTTKTEKRIAFEKMGVDILIEFPLNEKTAVTLPEAFIERYLVEQMGASYIVAGTDLSFGDRGAGNCELLQKYASRYDYRVEIIDKVQLHGVEISSTYVRSQAEQGNMELVAELLGEPYAISGTVAAGRKLGRKMGMPTVNVIPDPEKLLPAYGVYYSRVLAAGRIYNAITNVGCKPTVTDKKTPLAESYLYGFEGDLYGKDVTVELLSFKRAEMKFRDVDALKAQMQIDIAEGRAYHLTGNDI